MATTTISAGQSISNQTFTNGDGVTVLAGGTSSNDIIGPPGVESVFGSSFGDTVSGFVVSGSGSNAIGHAAELIVQSGGFVAGPQILAGGYLAISAGGLLSGASLSNATLSAAGGTVVGANLVRTTAYIYDSAAVLSGATVGDGTDVELGGSLIGGTIAAGGKVAMVGTPGFANAAGVTVLSGGTMSIGLYSAFGTVLAGGTATVSGNPASRNTTGDSGKALATQILSGGVLTVNTDATDSGTIIGPGGLEQIYLANAQAVVISGGTLELENAAKVVGYTGVVRMTAQENGPITFAGSGGTLLDDGADAPSSVISGFNTTDRIILAGVAADPNATLTVSGDTATISAGGQAYVLDIVGASAMPLTLGIGTTAGTIDIGVACYCAGTTILTAEGEVAVETVAPGDILITADGRAEPVTWVGRRSYAGRFLRGQPHLLPIRIRAGALGRRLPRRDLLLSPNHALLLDGVLVPAEALVDGVRITVERSCEHVDYIHVELARHDVILAEGVPAETFLDDGSRGIFHRGEGTPGHASLYCLPRMSDGFELEAVRRRLAGPQALPIAG